MTTPPPPPPGPGGSGQTFTVNEDNVLAARKVILQATENARARLMALQPDLSITAPAHDDISVAAARTWNGNLQGNADSHLSRLIQYVSNVEVLGTQLEEAAKQYGYTEEEIAASFSLQERRL